MIYTIKQFPTKKFTDKMDLTRFIKSNFDDILKAKMMEYKNEQNKAIDINSLQANFTPKIEDITSDIIEIKAVANSTNVIDSHLDLHTYKCWNKSAKECKSTYALESHQKEFNKVLNRKALNSNEAMNFQDFGFKNLDFTANLSTFTLKKSDNPLMFEKYANGDVVNHSVGMLYVAGKLELAYYDEESEKNMEFFEKYKKEALNPEVADEYGYFWVVSESVKREVSAVVFGSNPITPTLSVKNYEPSNHSNSNKSEPLENNTQKEKLKEFLNLIKI